jgi:serine/threonine protein kinase/tetratricopeptide (TPR) repeat protein
VVTLEDIFLAAVEKAPADRAAYLDAACGPDAQLRAQVEALLRSHEEAGSLLEQPLFRPGPTVDEPPAAEQPGAVVGPYKLLELIGEGGMGAVWMAEQTEPIRRRVALKVIKAGMDSRQVLARFEAERQALALMEHPNIARVLDAGRTPSGRPYFVMELVKGKPITSYCDEKRLGVRERLELFGDVCRAVQHAHQKGIIHRDLKPSNVLVAPYDGKPVVKVIDFGVAKATGQRLTDKTLFTAFGALVGTPEYMSPEQAEANNQDIDTRSDIYALGVLLYELLTGSTPLTRKRIKEAALLEVLRVIREEEPPRPSTRLSESKDSLPSISAQRHTEPAKLTRLVRGELDWIVMKALEKDRNRRYETANGFAMDVQRYLADEPVQACPPSAGYRLRKFARRNKGALLTAALVAAVLLGATAVSVWQAVRATEALESDRRTRAALDKQRTQLNGKIGDALVELVGRREKARTAGAINEKHWSDLHDVVRHADTLAGSELADPALVERVRSLLGQIRQDEKDWRMTARLEMIRIDSLRAKPDTPAARDIISAYSAAFWEYGLPVAKLSVAEASGRVRASGIRENLLAGLDAWSVWDARAKGTAWKGFLAVAQAADDHPWRRECRDAVLRGDRPALVKLARRADSPRQPTEAVLFLAGALAVPPPDRPATAEVLSIAAEMVRKATVWHPGEAKLGFALVAWFPSKSRLVDLAALLREDVERLKKEGAGPDVLAAAYVRLAGSLGDAKGKEAEIVAAYRQAIRLMPRQEDYRRALVNLQRNDDEKIAECSDWILADPGNPAPYVIRARAFRGGRQYQLALQDLIKATDLDPHEASTWADRADAHSCLGLHEDALAGYMKAIEAAQKKGDPNKSAAGYWHGRACAYSSLGQWDKAIADSTRAIDLAPDQPTFWVYRGHSYRGRGETQRALEDYDMAIKCTPSPLPPGMAPLGHYYRGMLNQQLGRWDEAIGDWAECLKLSPTNQHVRMTLANLVRNCPERSQRDPRRPLKTSKGVEPKPQPFSLSEHWQIVGTAHYQLGEWQKAVAGLTRAVKELPGAGFQLAMAHWQLGDHAEARKCYDQAVRWMDGNKVHDTAELRQKRSDASKLLASPKKSQ